MIGMMLLLNWRMQEYYQLAYNDAFLEFFIFACIYMVSKNRPLFAMIMLSLAISIKAGGLLMLPAVLGWTQYKYGTIKLVQSIIILISIQAIVAGPFLS